MHYELDNNVGVPICDRSPTFFFSPPNLSKFDWPIAKISWKLWRLPQNRRFYGKMEGLPLWPNYILSINSLRLSQSLSVCDRARVCHRQTTGPGPALPEEESSIRCTESRRRNKGRDAQLPQPQRPELHRRAPTSGSNSFKTSSS
jgi:hypothetical protein